MRCQQPVSGILNGLDTAKWNPKSDKNIHQTFSKKNLDEGKADNKQHLRALLSLKQNEIEPIFSFVGRLSDQKGIDLLLEILPKLLDSGYQAAILGQGEKRYQDLLIKVAQAHKGCLAVCNDFNEELGHQIYAGSDFFLMPSKFEPFGIVFLESMARGKITIASNTQGARELIQNNEDGFIFEIGNYMQLRELLNKTKGKKLDNIKKQSITSAKKFKVSNIIDKWEELF